jgi:hypothetical protein
MSASYALNATSASSAISSSFANTAGSLVTTSNYQMASLGVGTAPVAPFKGNFYGQVIVQNGINNATGQQSLIFAYPGITNNLTHSIWSGHDNSVANYNKLDFYISKTDGTTKNVLSLRSSQPVLIGSDTGLGLTVSGSTVISGSLTSTTGITGSLLGTSSFANTATSASYALTASFSLNVPVTSSYANNSNSASYALSSSFATTASYLSGYVSPFPFTGSAIISGSLTVTGSVAVSNLSGSGVRYLVADSSGSITAQSASAALKSTQAFTSTAGQTTFAVTNGYSTGYVDVFINGSKLATAEFTDTSGTNIVLATGSFINDTVEVVKYTPAAGVTNNVLRQLTTFTASAAQTVFSASYTPGLLDIFYNGSRLSPADFTANNGTFFTLATGSAANDILDVLVYSYQVGAFSGIGGVGTADQIAFFGTTNSITGSPNFTISGSTMLITGSLTISGSSTFTNIGPAVFSGSLTSTAGFTGSFSGTATSASYAANAELLDGLDSTVFTLTSSFAAQTASFTAFTSSILSYTASQNILNGKYATTGSNTFTGIQTVNSNLIVTGSITAQTLVVQTITSSVDFVTGSTRFGSLSSNTHVFTGSMFVTGAFYVTTGSVGLGTSIPNGKLMLYSPSGGGDLFQNIISSTGGSTKVGINFSPAVLENYPSLYPAQASIYAVDDNYSAYIVFATKVSGAVANSLTERMRITAAGNVGIGTSSPSTALYVVGTTTINGDDGSLYQRAVTANAAVYWDIRNSVNTRRAYVGFGGNASSLFDITNSEGDTRFIFASTERMRITSAGNVGIGTSSPASLLHLASSVAGTSVPFFIQNTNASGTGAQITFAPNANFGFGDNAATISSSTSAGGYDVALVFGTYKSAVGPAEKMRITGAGSVLINTTTVIGADSMLAISAGSAREGLVIKLTAGAYSPIWIRNSSDVAMFYVNEANTGYLNASAWSYGSDRRIKENIINLEGSGLDIILKLNPVRFDYIDGIKNNIGWIAQDVQEVIPEAVSAISKTNDQLTLKSDYIVPYLVKAIQEQQTLITALQEKLERNNIN